jgi:hypothetical protein
MTAAWRRRIGGRGNGGGEAVGAGKAVVHGVLIFLIYSKLAQHRNRKRMSYLVPKIPKFCMLLGWGIMKNFLYCANIQISIDIELKFLE